MKSHLQSYPCPLQINSFWNLGLLLGITIILQIIHPIIGFIFKIIPEIVNRKSSFVNASRMIRNQHIILENLQKKRVKVREEIKIITNNIA